MDREVLGKRVRELVVPITQSHWGYTRSWDDADEDVREMYRCIGEALAREVACECAKACEAFAKEAEGYGTHSDYTIASGAAMECEARIQALFKKV